MNIENIVSEVNKYRDLILKAHEFIWSNPETGFREVKTSAYLEKAFEELGYDLVKAENIPGFYTVVDTGKPGPEVLILGELDALICTDHPDADKKTGAVHCCGHSAQSAALLGVAAVLKNPEFLEDLCGKIRLCAVPAEELIELEYRTQLKNEGKINYLGGKSEFLYRGYFDGVDLAFMVHTTPGDDFRVRRGGVGCVVKQITYKGVSAHAGGNPWDGCNALYAATQGISAVNAIRETFCECDIIRVHPIITNGGNVVNAIPDNVVLENQVRGSNFDAIMKANKKVNRALCGAALSLGANIEIKDMPGYAPLVNAEGLIEIAKEASLTALGAETVYYEELSSGCTDMGDLSTMMPVVHPLIPGASGTSHGSDFKICNPEKACVDSAKWQLAILTLLLKDNAARAKQIIKEYKPMFNSKEEYFKYIDDLNSEGYRINYREDGIAEVKL